MKNLNPLLSSILIVALSGFIQLANAQIVYTDVIPDQTIENNSYDLDLNNDGINDYTITLSLTPKNLTCGRTCSFASLAIEIDLKIEPLSGNEVESNAEMISNGFAVDSTLLWSNNNEKLASIKYYQASCSYSGCFGIPTKNGDWVTGASGKYLALKILVGAQNYFGWIRMDVDSDVMSLTIKDYAYNSIPNQAILGGQTCPPQSVISPTGPISFCVGDSAILSSVNSGTDLSYQWKLGGANIIGATNKSYTAKTAGNYKVKVTDNTNVCSATSSKVKVKVPCRVLNVELNSGLNFQVSIFPNPFSQATAISYQLSDDQNVSIKIFDLEGKLIRTLANEMMIAGVQEVPWDTCDDNGNAVSAGIYFLRIQSSDFSQTVKLMVTK